MNGLLIINHVQSGSNYSNSLLTVFQSLDLNGPSTILEYT